MVLSAAYGHLSTRVLRGEGLTVVCELPTVLHGWDGVIPGLFSHYLDLRWPRRLIWLLPRWQDSAAG